MFITHACFVSQELVPQSNFGDTLECVDWIEQTSISVSFALCMRGGALWYWHYWALLWHSRSCVCMHNSGGACML